MSGCLSRGINQGSSEPRPTNIVQLQPGRESAGRQLGPDSLPGDSHDCTRQHRCVGAVHELPSIASAPGSPASAPVRPEQHCQRVIDGSRRRRASPSSSRIAVWTHEDVRTLGQMTAGIVERVQDPDLTQDLGGTARDAHRFRVGRKPRLFLKDGAGNPALSELQRQGKSTGTSPDNGDWRVPG